MALSPRAQSLFRAQDTAANPTYLMPIDPKNWRIKSTKVAPYVPANPNEGKPRYLQADYIGGVKGDLPNSTANVAVARDDGSANEPDYAPRTFNQKATQYGTVPVVDVGRNLGWIGPKDPYAAPPASPAQDPTLTTLTPATAVSGLANPPFTVKLTGTKFTPYSNVIVAGNSYPFKYISPTELWVVFDPRSSVAGTTTVAVQDHGITTANKTFTWT